MVFVQRLRKFSLYVASTTLLLVVGAVSADWPQYQGPNRDGISTETGIAHTWPEDGLKAVWSVPVGKGFGSPAIRDGEVFVLDRVVGESDTLRCLSLATGEELWTFSYEAPSKVSYPGSRTSPTVTEKYVYTVGVMGDFYCVDRKTHEPVWHHKLIEEFSSKAVPNWGVSQAPSVHGDLVIVAPQAPKTSVAAFNRFTGEMVWTSPGIAGVGYVSPVVKTLHGVAQVLMINPAGRRQPTTVSGLSIEDGTVLWRYEDWNCRIPIPFPTVLPNHQVFVTGGYEGGSALFEVTKNGSEFGTKTIFETMEFGSQIQQPLLMDGVLYGNSNSNKQKDGMSSLTLDGTLKWNTKGNRALPNFDFGTLLGVDGLILNLEGRKGTLHLIEPSTDGYKELASAKVLSGKQIWAPMAFSDGKLVLRSQEELKCIDLRNP